MTAPRKEAKVWMCIVWNYLGSTWEAIPLTQRLRHCSGQVPPCSSSSPQFGILSEWSHQECRMLDQQADAFSSIQASQPPWRLAVACWCTRVDWCVRLLAGTAQGEQHVTFHHASLLCAASPVSLDLVPVFEHSFTATGKPFNMSIVGTGLRAPIPPPLHHELSCSRRAKGHLTSRLFRTTCEQSDTIWSQRFVL